MIKRIIFLSVFGAMVVLGARVYLLKYAIQAMYMGCKEAAMREYRFSSQLDGNDLNHFCHVRKDMVEAEWDDLKNL